MAVLPFRKKRARGEPASNPELGTLAHAALVLAAQGEGADAHCRAIWLLNRATEEIRDHARRTGAWPEDTPF